MTITIPLSIAAESKLKEQAAASGQDLTAHATELLERAVSNGPEPAPQLPAAQRAAEWRAWAEGHPTADHFVDASRESIYAVRTYVP